MNNAKVWIDFLERLRPQEFDISLLVSKYKILDGKPVGVVCCAVGWFPRIFPQFARWVKQGSCVFVELFDGNETFMGSHSQMASMVTGIDHDDIDRLLDGKTIHGYKGLVVGDSLTSKQLANNLRRYLAQRTCV